MDEGMFGTLLFISGQEIIFALLIALLLFGSKEIPRLARTFGKGMKEFRRATEDIQREIESSTPEMMDDLNEIKTNITREAGEIKKNLTRDAEEIKKNVSRDAEKIKKNVSRDAEEIKKNMSGDKPGKGSKNTNDTAADEEGKDVGGD